MPEKHRMKRCQTKNIKLGKTVWNFAEVKQLREMVHVKE